MRLRRYVSIAIITAVLADVVVMLIIFMLTKGSFLSTLRIIADSEKLFEMVVRLLISIGPVLGIMAAIWALMFDRVIGMRVINVGAPIENPVVVQPVKEHTILINNQSAIVDNLISVIDETDNVVRLIPLDDLIKSLYGYRLTREFTVMDTDKYAVMIMQGETT